MNKALFFAISLAISSVSFAKDWSFVDNTALLSIRQGSPLTERANQFSQYTLENHKGQIIYLRDRYKPRLWTDMHFEFATQVHPQAALVWGFSTGQKAPNYVIDPSYTLGIRAFFEPHRNAMVFISYKHVFEGYAREKPCLGDYREFGTMEVNCRLAASVLAPQETLRYNDHSRPLPRDVFQLQYRYVF